MCHFSSCFWCLPVFSFHVYDATFGVKFILFMAHSTLWTCTTVSFAECEMFPSVLCIFSWLYSFFLLYFWNFRYMNVGTVVIVPQITEAQFSPILLLLFRFINSTGLFSSYWFNLLSFLLYHSLSLFWLLYFSVK